MMAHRQPKKKRPSGLFDNILSKVEGKKRNLTAVHERLEAVKNVDLVRIMSDACVLTEDEALQLLASKISIEGLLNLRSAYQHVPKNIPRVVNRISLRSTFVFKTFKSLSSASQNIVIQGMSMDDFLIFVKFAEMFCSSFLSERKASDNLWNLTKEENLPFNKFLTPPVDTCVQCEKTLCVRNNPSKAKLFTLEGPIPATKITLECRNCSIVYGVCNYSDECGTHFYAHDFNIDIIEVSNVTYMDVKLYKWFPSLSNHCWVSFAGFAEAYNDVFEADITRYRLNTSTCLVETDNEVGDEPVLESPDPEGKELTKNIGVLPGELSAKVIAQCFWHREVEEELSCIGLREKWTFSSKEHGPTCGTYDNAMEMVDKMRCDQLYKHECSDHCRSKGCGRLYVADGNWKLRYAHCMWKVPVSIKGFGKINYPCVCPLSPKRGHAFCEAHCEKAQQLGYPTELKQFYKHCGVSNENVNEALEGMFSASQTLAESSYQSITSCLDGFAEQAAGDEAVNASTFQGTAEFLQANPEFVKDQSLVEDTVCNKDTGGLKVLHCWSRGIFFIVSAGGHIEYWQPLYRSESPTQAFLVTILWLYRKFQGMQEEGHSDETIREAMSLLCLAYDNMCHMDGLLIAREDLPLPKPFNEAWKLISKVIDRLHLRNHVDEKCKRLYNPDDKVPENFNTMACEQTFIWAI